MCCERTTSLLIILLTNSLKSSENILEMVGILLPVDTIYKASTVSLI